MLERIEDRQHRQRRVLDRRRIGQSTLGIGERPAQQLLDLSRVQRLKLVNLATREQRRVDLEIGVLSSGPNQGQKPFLHRRQQRILLRLIEAMNLIEKEHSRSAA
jgi:hypothetical protein